ncbi:hypothetical protein IQ277_11720 [Nostocales cyanobacterium LEGE 12452]|nr:hypothetical protein [Nostocales cyanobacterium LEGE 12452]
MYIVLLDNYHICDRRTPSLRDAIANGEASGICLRILWMLLWLLHRNMEPGCACVIGLECAAIKVVLGDKVMRCKAQELGQKYYSSPNRWSRVESPTLWG